MTPLPPFLKNLTRPHNQSLPILLTLVHISIIIQVLVRYHFSYTQIPNLSIVFWQIFTGLSVLVVRLYTLSFENLNTPSGLHFLDSTFDRSLPCFRSEYPFLPPSSTVFDTWTLRVEYYDYCHTALRHDIPATLFLLWYFVHRPCGFLLSSWTTLLFVCLCGFCHTIHVYMAHRVCPYIPNGCLPTLRSVRSTCAHSTLRTIKTSSN